MRDRAALVAYAVTELLIDTMDGEFSPAEFYRRLETLLRDEFADVQREAIADRELPDA
jgi:hypothetical protein